MPFEPRLIRPDDVCDDETELALPADLAELAEQLTADANHIASTYSASSGATLRQASPAVPAQLPVEAPSRWRRAATAAAILLIASAGVARWVTWPETPQAALPTILLGGHHHVASDPQPAVDTAVPAQFFQGLSGPEREGLLDLLERDTSQQSSLSI